MAVQDLPRETNPWWKICFSLSKKIICSFYFHYLKQNSRLFFSYNHNSTNNDLPLGVEILQRTSSNVCYHMHDIHLSSASISRERSECAPAATLGMCVTWLHSRSAWIIKCATLCNQNLWRLACIKRQITEIRHCNTSSDDSFTGIRPGHGGRKE